MQTGCSLFVSVSVYKLGSSFRGGFKALKDGLIICRHGFNRICLRFFWVQKGADVPAWYSRLRLYWKCIKLENKWRKAALILLKLATQHFSFNVQKFDLSCGQNFSLSFHRGLCSLKVKWTTLLETLFMQRDSQLCNTFLRLHTSNLSAAEEINLVLSCVTMHTFSSTRSKIHEKKKNSLFLLVYYQVNSKYQILFFIRTTY